MIAMSLLSTYDEYRRDRIAHIPVYPVPPHPVRRALLHALSLLGLGVGGIGTIDDDETIGIG